MIKKIKKSIVNITIEYINFKFISNYNNCLLIDIKKDKLNKDSLVFLTGEGFLKSVNLEDNSNIKVSIFPV